MLCQSLKLKELLRSQPFERKIVTCVIVRPISSKNGKFLGFFLANRIELLHPSDMIELIKTDLKFKKFNLY